jgi:DNA repair photolyase
MPGDAEYRDALPSGAVRGRGAGLAPGNRFESVRLHVLGEALDDELREHPCGKQVRTEVLPDHARSVINRVDSDDLNFNWTFNPYRGCEHGCIYCYARPTHENLGYSSGLDFETKILAKLDAPELLARELTRPKWQGDSIMVSGVTDPYQPTEAKLKLMRACLDVFAERRQPISIVTKNHLVTRDLDLLQALAHDNAVSVAVSITTLDKSLAAKMEPRASSPADRLRTVRELNEAGVPVGVMMAPVIPGLTDHEIPRVLEAAADAGARCASWVMLRLPHQVKALFLEWVARHYPDRAAMVEQRIRDMRDGELYDSTFRVRQRGRGERAAQVKQSFDLFARRFGLDGQWPKHSNAAFLERKAEFIESEKERNENQLRLFSKRS